MVLSRLMAHRYTAVLCSKGHQPFLTEGRLVHWLWWGETDVSELRPLGAYCSSPGDCDVDHGMMVSTGANS
jgi:hypothetical protein